MKPAAEHRTGFAVEVVRTLALLGLLTTAASASEAPVVLETPGFRFQLAPDSGRYEILDKQAAQPWRSNPFQARFGQVTLNQAGKQQRVDLAAAEARREGEGLVLTFHPLPNQAAAVVRVRLEPAESGRALEFTYEAPDSLPIESVRLLEDALWVSGGDGYVVLPVREGLLVPADSGLSFTNRFDTFAYEGCHMEMFGVAGEGAAALVTWHDPYAAVELKSVTRGPAGKQVLAPSLVLRKSAKSFRIHFLGRGDYVTIGKAYREVANGKGWLVPWSEKLKGHPERAKLFGAANYKLWSTLSRRMNEESSAEVSSRVNWTFDEAALIAEHLKRDLELERVLFIIGGWIHRGYDNQHPDILPTAPECGGDAAFADCARRVMQLGYLFCLHDNYQDIYRDSPSWNETLMMKNPDGSLAKGGLWAGGRAYLTCSQQAVQLAKRPQNLPAVKALSHANAYFIDTTYAVGLLECFDKQHPLTRQDDMRWKQAISDYAREIFGVFGSECGREWAIPHSDFFEGLTGVSGAYYHNKDLPKSLGASVVPLFEIVYRDCIAMYGKYGYDFSRAAEYVLHHLSIGRPLHYHSIPEHLYWKNATNQAGLKAASAAAGPGDPALFTRGDNGWTEGLHLVDRFVKNTYEILSPLNELTSQMPMTGHQFLTPDRKVQRSVFGEGPGAVEVVVNAGKTPFSWKSRQGGETTLPSYGFLVESAEFVAFHASAWNGVQYSEAPLFCLRSLDKQPLERSGQIRVFHGFGDARLKLGGAMHSVAKQTVIRPGRND